MKKKSLITGAIAVTCILLVLVFIGKTGIILHETFSKEDLKLAEDAVRKYAVQCYALEGHYPQDIKYLTDNYTLSLNDEFVYHYEYIGDNMMPDINVFPRD